MIITLASIDKKIANYLGQLNVDQKKTVLSVAKALADASYENDIWEDESFVTEMETRNAEFENGTSKGYTWEEVKAGTRKAIAKMSYTSLPLLASRPTTIGPDRCSQIEEINTEARHFQAIG